MIDKKTAYVNDPIKWIGTCWTCKNIDLGGTIIRGGYTVTCPHNAYEHRISNTSEDYKECENYIEEIREEKNTW